jgi:hypothetical protein
VSRGKRKVTTMAEVVVQTEFIDWLHKKVSYFNMKIVGFVPFMLVMQICLFLTATRRKMHEHNVVAIC